NDKTILQEDVTDSTDTVERALVKSLMMPLSFNELLFESIEKKEGGYLFTLARHANIAELNESVESLGGVYTSSGATLFVDLQDEKTLKAINYQQTVYFDIEGKKLVSNYSFEMEILE
ncbi:MAG: hypothetical protein IJX08_07955, partial [Clostridia bacterium]|nr:hypothetical protein [Clostridia bacterium]